MQNTLLRSSRQRGASRLPAVLALLVLFGGGVLAYRHFFNRPGESAVALIPADALMVATLDTNPSPQQVATFKKIADSLKREGLDGDLNKTLASAGMGANGSPTLGAIQPYWKNSFAFALLRKPGASLKSEPDTVVLAAVSNTGAVREALAKAGTQASQDGMDYYSIPKDKTCTAIISDYVVISDAPGPLARINAVYKGDTKSVSTLPDYQSARAALPADTNLMFFMSPSLWTDMLSSSGDKSLVAASSNAARSARWVAMGMTMRDGGIEFVTQTPVVAPNGAALPAPPAPLSADLARRLPAGAYGLMTFSQPGRYWDWVQMAAGQDASFKKGLDDGVAEFEKQTGMSVPQDILPGLTGDLTLAVYPDASKSTTQGVDGLIIIDDANGANPAVLAEKVRALVERESSKDGRQGVHFVSTQRGNATVWTLDQATDESLHRAIAGGPNTTPNGGDTSSPTASEQGGNSWQSTETHGGDTTINGNNNEVNSNNGNNNGNGNGSYNGNSGNNNGNGNGSYNGNNNGDYGNNGSVAQGGNGGDAYAQGNNAYAQGGNGGNGGNGYNGEHGGDAYASGNSSSSSMTTQGGNPAAEIMKTKTVVYAQIGNSILMASSQAMLDKALASYQSGGTTLADDAHYTTMLKSLPTGSQTALFISASQIMEAVRPLIVKSMRGDRSGLTPDDITELFGGETAGMTGSARYDGKAATSTFFLPLNYDKLIHIIGVFKNQAQSGNQGSGGANNGVM